MCDELNEPLGFVSGGALALALGRRRAKRGTAIGIAILAVGVGLVMLARQDFRAAGEPFAVAKIEVLSPPRKPDAPDVTASMREPVAPPVASAEQVETTSGVKVTRGIGAPPKALIIDVQRALAAKGSSSQSNPSANQ